MPDKVEVKKTRSKKIVSKPLKEENADVVVEDLKPIMYGISTTNLTSPETIMKGEQVDILEDNGDEWLTNKGLVSKLFLLLKKI